MSYEYALYITVRLYKKLVFESTKLGFSLSIDQPEKKSAKRIFKVLAILLLPITSVRFFYLLLVGTKSSHEFENLSFRTRIDVNVKAFIFFSPIDWSYRKQRPQNLAISLNKIGKDIFYINPTIIYHSKKNNDIKITRIDGINVCTFYSNFYRNNYYVGVKEVPNEIGINFARLVEHMIAQLANFSNVIVIQQPGWWSVVRHLQGNQLVFDCMDLHNGFDPIVDKVDAIENQIDNQADKIVVTSQYLLSLKEKDFPRKSTLVQNGVDCLHFRLLDQPSSTEQIVIGYFGAIAEWFDTRLVGKLAQNNPKIRFEIIGLVTDSRVARDLSIYPNVFFLGEVPNSELPLQIIKWRAGMIPFKLSPLIMATNPVKMYEYASCGLPILATDIPEVRAVSHSMTGVFVASTEVDFQKNLEAALQLPPENRKLLRDWAQNHSWDHRARELLISIQSGPRVSVIVLMWNQGLLTLNCLKSIYERSDYNNLEVILVDNGSEQAESEIVTDWITNYNLGQTIYYRNEENIGFAAGNNVGINLATGEFIVVLNNDTEVTPGWIWRALKHFSANPQLGLLGPSTNNCGNQARIKLRNETGIWLQEVVPRFGFRVSKAINSKSLAFFCVFIPRSVLDEVGLISEEFGKGYFEDDDYCRRVEAAGYEISIARDIFVYHQMGATFDLLGDLAKTELFNKNKAIYESKWGQWMPHTYNLDEDQI